MSKAYVCDGCGERIKDDDLRYQLQIVTYKRANQDQNKPFTRQPLVDLCQECFNNNEFYDEVMPD